MKNSYLEPGPWTGILALAVCSSSDCFLVFRSNQLIKRRCGNLTLTYFHPMRSPLLSLSLKWWAILLISHSISYPIIGIIVIMWWWAWGLDMELYYVSKTFIISLIFQCFIPYRAHCKVLSNWYMSLLFSTETFSW